jgi:hypothetical protein
LRRKENVAATLPRRRKLRNLNSRDARTGLVQFLRPDHDRAHCPLVSPRRLDFPGMSAAAIMKIISAIQHAAREG